MANSSIKKEVSFEGRKYRLGKQERVAASAVVDNDNTYSGSLSLPQGTRLKARGNISASVNLPYMGLLGGVATSSGSSVVTMPESTMTVGAAHFGKTVVCTAACTVTLPGIAVGQAVTIVNGAADGTALTISPNASDKFVLNAAGATGTNNKDITNPADYSKNGDFCHLAYGSADGWIILARGGVWNDEA